MNLRATIFFLVALHVAAALPPTNAADVELYFSPNGGAALAIAREITAAKKTIRVQAYSISEASITAALIAAHTRGVAVSLIVDPHQQNDLYSSAPKMKKAGIPTLCDRAHALQHNKTMVIDDATVITGSMNFTRSGDKNNAENTLIIRDAATAARYAADWTLHHDHSTTYTVTHGKDYRPPPTPPNLVLPPKNAHAQEP